ncbi:DUF4041 domain-containing protein [Ruminococcaceae bacterium OttesenSCG-928-I18]|nr:DUF4041 domain-containing protein [Ruminococcaceae bacterium OttesenSCG-928-I18]
MSLLGGKEKQEIESLKKQLNEYYSWIQHLESQLSPDHQQIIQIKKDLSFLEQQLSLKNSELQSVANEVAALYKRKELLSSEIVQLDDEVLYQDFALYRPVYNFANSDEYKNRLDWIRQQQKNMIKSKTAVNFFAGWTVDGSKAKGTKMNNDNIKQILRTFNTECENAIDRVKFNNTDSMRKRIIKSYESLNKLNETVKIQLRPEYLNLKLEELNLAIEYAMKKQEEKEEQRRIREELREQQKLQKEIEEARKALAKEQTHYKNALASIDTQLSSASEEHRADLEAKRNEILSRLGDLDESIKQVDYREANQKAGYVYIISNIGTFGEGVYKIGMTRRLEPMDRVAELGDASVPFVFDVHAMIFSEDAPKLESSLHKAFDSRKVNCVNTRKEFFRCTLDEIKQVVRKNHDKTVEFTDLPEAEHYRQSLQMRKQRT